VRTQRCLLNLPGVLPPAEPFSTTFPVNRSDDTNNGNCDAGCSLREAIESANTNSGSSTLTEGINYLKRE